MSDAGETEHISKNTTSRVEARFSWLKPLARFLAWWFGFFALLGPLSTCPVCGQAGCPGGAASAGVLGGLLAVLAFIPRRLWRMLRKPREGKANAQ